MKSHNTMSKILETERFIRNLINISIDVLSKDRKIDPNTT